MNRPVAPEAVAVHLDPAKIRTIMIGVVLAMLLGALDQTIVATALPTIGRELNDVENLSWVVTAYLLTSTAVTPLYGKLSDVHGRRRHQHRTRAQLKPRLRHYSFGTRLRQSV